MKELEALKCHNSNDPQLEASGEQGWLKKSVVSLWIAAKEPDIALRCSKSSQASSFVNDHALQKSIFSEESCCK